MEGIGIWIFLLLFYLLQALTKRKQKQRKQQQSQAPSPKPSPQQARRPGDRQTQQPSTDEQRGQTPQKPQRPVSLEDLFNPDKLRDILGVPQPKPDEPPQPIQRTGSVRPKSKRQMRKRWDEPQQSKASLQHDPEVRETGSKVASADITDVDESAAAFKGSRLGKSDITSDFFDERKDAPGKKKPKLALEYFDEPEDIRNAIILKEILDRPRAFRRNIR